MTKANNPLLSCHSSVHLYLHPGRPPPIPHPSPPHGWPEPRGQRCAVTVDEWIFSLHPSLILTHNKHTQEVTPDSYWSRAIAICVVDRTLMNFLWDKIENMLQMSQTYMFFYCVFVIVWSDFIVRHTHTHLSNCLNVVVLEADSSRDFPQQGHNRWPRCLKCNKLFLPLR